MAEKFDNLEEHLEKFVENIRQLGIIVSDFQPSSQTGLNQKLNFMITGLQDIEKCRQQLHDINVPLEVFENLKVSSFLSWARFFLKRWLNIRPFMEMTLLHELPVPQHFNRKIMTFISPDTSSTSSHRGTVMQT
uniref:Mediator of RNA polymerase II transcription subunit 10 n=1 Tax=Cyprinus carpio carpio TaxID=630221 RepID=A0A9J7X931_CYPCA